jgi:hypothetical protein
MKKTKNLEKIVKKEIEDIGQRSNMGQNTREVKKKRNGKFAFVKNVIL